jgi:hypothetical protein
LYHAKVQVPMQILWRRTSIKKVLESKALYPELRSWFRFRNDTFALWRGTVERLHSFFNTLNSFDSYLQFTMEVGGSSLSFLHLFITIEERRFIVNPPMRIYILMAIRVIPDHRYWVSQRG